MTTPMTNTYIETQINYLQILPVAARAIGHLGQCPTKIAYSQKYPYSSYIVSTVNSMLNFIKDKPSQFI